MFEYLLYIQVQLSCEHLNILGSIFRERSWWRYKFGCILFLKPRGCFNSYREIHISREKKGELERDPMTLQHLEINQKRKRKKWIEKKQSVKKENTNRSM